MKTVTPNFFILHAGNVNIGEAVEQEVMYLNKVETVREFTYLGDRVSGGGRRKAVVTARISTAKCCFVAVKFDGVNLSATMLMQTWTPSSFEDAHQAIVFLCVFHCSCLLKCCYRITHSSNLW